MTRVSAGVEDADREPLPRPASNDAVHGRGLHIIDALGRDWGVERLSGGKVVWAELPLR